ncbi:hypothetical protein [Amycolatopsis taiwanensis]|uniref:hypothetical protein n=1 Tax=Amycolatopsis taiwanensis TaxID=342230 RepID=UPI00047FB294
MHLNQALVTEGNAVMFPSTAEALTQRNEALRNLTAIPAGPERPEHSGLVLPDFEGGTQRIS